jgi:hypothetical protein
MLLWVCDLCSYNLPAERNNFGQGVILLSYLVSELQKHCHRDSNPRQIFVVVAFVPVISWPKQTTFFLALFFYRAYFPSYRNLHRGSNPGQILVFVASIPVISWPKQIFSWRRSSIVISFRAAEIIFETGTQDCFVGLWPLFL